MVTRKVVNKCVWRVWLVVLVPGSSTTDESVVVQADDETGSLAIAGSFALAPQLVGGGVVPGSASVDSKLSLAAASNWSISSSSGTG